jgi:hypothetical protein
MNYKDPVCDSCENASWEKGEYGTMRCVKHNIVIRKRGTVTEEFAYCLGADYKRRKKGG